MSVEIIFIIVKFSTSTNCLYKLSVSGDPKIFSEQPPYLGQIGLQLFASFSGYA